MMVPAHAKISVLLLITPRYVPEQTSTNGVRRGLMRRCIERVRECTGTLSTENISHPVYYKTHDEEFISVNIEVAKKEEKITFPSNFQSKINNPLNQNDTVRTSLENYTLKN